MANIRNSRFYNLFVNFTLFCNALYSHDRRADLGTIFFDEGVVTFVLFLLQVVFRQGATIGQGWPSFFLHPLSAHFCQNRQPLELRQ